MEGWREDRREERMRVEVRGADSSGHLFSRRAYTVNLSRQGACLDWDEWLCRPGDAIEVEHAGQAAPFQVVWVGPVNTPLEGRFGIRVLDPAAYKIWGIPLPRPQRIPRTAEEQIRAAIAWFAPTLLDSKRGDDEDAGPWYRSVAFRAVCTTLSLSLLLFSAALYFLMVRDRAGEEATAKAAQAAVEIPSPAPVEQPPEPAAAGVESAPAGKNALAAVPAPPPAVSPRPFRYAVQAGAYRSHAQAEAVARRLSPDFKQVEVSPVNIGKETLYRVRVPAETRDAAEQHAARIRQASRLQTLVIRLP